MAYRTVFDTVYTPGKIEAVIYRNGAETGRCAVETAGDNVDLWAAADRAAIRADDTDLAYIDIELRDAEGRLNPGARKQVTVTVAGPAELQGLGSGDPQSEDPFFADTCFTWYGHALAAVRPTGAGQITVTAAAEGCTPVTVTVTAE